MKFIAIILTVATLMIAAGCTRAAGDDPVARAESEAAAGDVAAAQRMCDALLSDTAAFNALSAGQLCRLAGLFVSLQGDQEANDGAACRCLSRARTLDNDSVDIFLRTLDSDAALHLLTLDNVGAYLDMPREQLVTESDSVFADSVQHEF